MNSQGNRVKVVGGTVIDGNGGPPIEGQSIWIENGRITAMGIPDRFGEPFVGRTIDARGKFIIPGLMNANVHLFGAISLERLARHYGNYEDIIVEAAQVALKSGLTTVFDTWGPRRSLIEVRDSIAAGRIIGSRFFCAGNIIGFEGLFSSDFFPQATEIASAAFAQRINAMWVENVGRRLLWLTPERVGQEIRSYISKGIDFIKYAANDHYPGAFLAFSPRVQAAIVDEAHRAGISAQAHATSVEGLHSAVEAGCDLITHCNVTGPVAIPESTLERMARQSVGAVIFPWTERGLAWIKQNVDDTNWTFWQASDTNARNLIRSGAPLLLANDGTILPPELKTDPALARTWCAAPDELSLVSLTTGHFAWFMAMEEKGCKPMDMLRAATVNIAVAYGKDKDLGTLEVGKIADLLILDKDPLQAAENYRSIHMIMKDGAVVDRDALPRKPILTKPLDPPAEEEASYVPHITTGLRLPMCPMCMHTLVGHALPFVRS